MDRGGNHRAEFAGLAARHRAVEQCQHVPCISRVQAARYALRRERNMQPLDAGADWRIGLVFADRSWTRGLRATSGPRLQAAVAEHHETHRPAPVRQCVAEIRPDARVVLFSMHDSEMIVRRAFSLGASGFISKSCSPEHLVEAVRIVMAGRRYLSPGLPPGLMEPGGMADALALLTHREIEILRLIAGGESPTSCARALHLSPKTVSNLQSIIKGKLGISTPAGLVRIALRSGLLRAP